jgi:hypothetical protein
MVSHVSRATTVRARTLAAFVAMGARVHVQESTVEVGSDVEVKRMAWHALAHASRNRDGCVYVEDDILIDPDGWAWAMRQPWPRDRYDLITLGLIRTTLLADDRRHVTPGTPWRVVPMMLGSFHAFRGFHGTQGVWLAASLVDRALAHPEQFMNADGTHLTEPQHPAERERRKPCGFDFWLKDYAQRPAAVVPNVVTHDDTVPSTIPRGAS